MLEAGAVEIAITCLISWKSCRLTVGKNVWSRASRKWQAESLPPIAKAPNLVECLCYISSCYYHVSFIVQAIFSVFTKNTVGCRCVGRKGLPRTQFEAKGCEEPGRVVVRLLVVFIKVDWAAWWSQLPHSLPYMHSRRVGSFSFRISVASRVPKRRRKKKRTEYKWLAMSLKYRAN